MSFAVQNARIHKTQQKILREGTIPKKLEENFEKRLVITFLPIVSNSRGQVRQEKRVYRSRWKEKTARSIYLEVLRIDPHILIPFLLSISPKACETFDIAGFERCHTQRRIVLLGNGARSFLDDFATKHNLNEKSQFRQYLLFIFRPSELSRIVIV